MTTRVSAVLDQNVIHGEYFHFISQGGGSATADVTVRLIHQFRDVVGTTKEIELDSFVVPGSFLKTEGHDDVEDTVQTFEINIGNPRYLTDLFLETEEIRTSGTIVTRVPILFGDDPTTDDFPVNPIKEPLLENLPMEPLERPRDNIVVPEPILGTIVYALSASGLSQVQASKRAYLEDSIEFGEFLIQDYNEKIDRIFIENSISNLLPNYDFGDSTSIGPQVFPDKFEVTAPAIIISSKLEPGDVDDTNVWMVRVSNPNVFNAFNSVSIKLNEKTPMFSGSDSLTFSVYHKIASDFGQTPFSEFTIKTSYYDGSDFLISSSSKVAQVGSQDKLWHLISGTFQGSEIPLTAEKFDVELLIEDISTTEPFTLSLYLPQVEHLPIPTTRALSERILDRYKTSSDIKLDLPLTIQLKTRHRVNSPTRGLLDSTVSNKDGVQFFASLDKLYFKQIDASGTVLFNIVSDSLGVSDGDVATYSVYMDGTNVEFYLEETLVSSHPAAVVLDQTRSPIIGSLNLANTTINSEILDFRILKSKPGT